MIVCSNCKDRISHDEQPESGRRFPAYTVAAGFIGTLAGVSTGMFLLVPAAIVLGAAADVRRCEVCGKQVEEDDPGYQLMEEQDGEFGGQSYRSVGNPPKAGCPQQGFGPAASRHAPGTQQPTSHHEQMSPFDVPQVDDRPQQDAVFVFDEIEGRLVRTNPEPDEAEFDPDPLGWQEGESSTDTLPLSSDLRDDFQVDPFPDFGGAEDNFAGYPGLDEEPPTEDPTP